MSFADEWREQGVDDESSPRNQNGVPGLTPTGPIDPGDAPRACDSQRGLHAVAVVDPVDAWRENLDIAAEQYVALVREHLLDFSGIEL